MGASEMPSAKRLHLLRKEAKRSGDEEILNNFAPNVLLCIMDEQGQNAALGRTLDALRRCVKAREALHDLEREMDKDYFVTLVTGGYFQRSGIDRETQDIATWVRTGDFFKSTWGIQMGSPRAKSLVRAFVWIHEINIVQNTFQPSTKFSTYYNYKVGLLEFSPTIMGAVITYIKDLFPISNRGVIFAFGLHQALPVLWNMIFRIYPEVTAQMRVFESFSDAVDLVTDTDDIPDFWFSDEYDADKYRFKRTNTWCFERCLSDENRVTTKDLYNPGPWPYAADESVDVNSLAPSVKRDARATNGIDEIPGWLRKRGENDAPVSRPEEKRRLALDAIDEDHAESEDL